jgi:hypothetical protein
MDFVRVSVIAMLAIAFQPSPASESAASIPMLETQRDWTEVERIRQSADSAGITPYASMSGSWWLTPDGHLAVELVGPAEASLPRSAMLGRYAFDGPWMTVSVEGAAIDLDSLSPDARAEYDEWARAEEAVAEEIEAEAEPVHDADVSTAPGNDADDEAPMATEAPVVQRYLRVAHGALELLIDEAALVAIATAWKGQGDLEIPVYRVSAWRAPDGTVEPQDFQHVFRIADPLRAALPIELSRLLRVDPIEARATEALTQASTLGWRGGYSEFDLRLDRGSDAGLFVEMPVHGVAPDDEFRGKLIAVAPDHSTARFMIQRFSPRDPAVVPAVGMRFSTRELAPGQCALDLSAAVRGKVQATRTVTLGPEATEAGFAWAELSLDQGAAQGLAVGDVLLAESDDIEGEGRVYRVESHRSDVLWRMHRFDESHQPQAPGKGSALVTPAWRRVEQDVFGDELRAAPQSPAD